MKGFGQITRKYLGKPFSENNCLKLLYDIYCDVGAKVPNSYKGYGLDTYMKYWEESPEQALDDMVKLFKTIGKEANVKFLKKGDAVVVRYKSSRFPSIYIGNNNVMVATREKGTLVLPLGSRFEPILARRIL